MPAVIAREGGQIVLPPDVDRHSVIDHLIRYSAAAPFPCFRLKKGTLYAAEIVGTIQLGKLRLSILPKTDSGNDVRDKNFLLNLLRAAGYLGAPALSSQSSVRVTELDPLEAILSEIASELWSAVFDGAPRRYEEVRTDSDTIRGRIDFSQLARRLPSAGPRIPIRYSPLSAHNKLSRTIRWVAGSLLQMSRSAANRHAYEEILDFLGNVDGSPPSSAELSTIRLSRYETRWHRALVIAQLLADRQFIDPTFAGRTDAFGMLFPLQHLFERALRRILADAARCAGHTMTHRTEKLHFLHDSDGVGVVRLKPDFVFQGSGPVVMLGDAKWKRLTQTGRAYGVEREDIYQMNAYLTRYAVECAALFVPRMNWMHDGWQASYIIPVVSRNLHLISVDIEALVSRDKTIREQAHTQLATCLSGMLGRGGSVLSTTAAGDLFIPAQ